MLRPLLRKCFYTPNTIRYRVEWPRLQKAFSRVGPVHTLFDGGAGSGEFSRRALSSGYCQKVIALEYDLSNFQRLTENLGKRAHTQLIHGSLLEVPVPDASVDMVMSTQVIEHIQDHEKAASELNRVLRPGGWALITVPHPPEPFPNDDHVREGYTEEDLKTLFAPYGFEHLHTDYFLTRSTIRKMQRMTGLPGGGCFVPLFLVDQETALDDASRKADTPFGILTLFRKPL